MGHNADPLVSPTTLKTPTLRFLFWNDEGGGSAMKALHGSRAFISGLTPFHGRKRVRMSFSSKLFLALCAAFALMGCQDHRVDVYIHEDTGCQSDADCDEAYGDDTIASCIQETGACRYVTTNVTEVEAPPCFTDAECADDNASSADTCDEGTCIHTVRLGGVSTIVFGTQRMYGEYAAPYVSSTTISTEIESPQLLGTFQIINDSGSEFVIDELDFGATTALGHCAEVTADYRYYTEFVYEPIEGLELSEEGLILNFDAVSIPASEMVWIGLYCRVNAATEAAEAVLFTPRWEWNPDIPVYTDSAPVIVYFN